MYINKEEIQALIDQHRTNLAEVEYLDLESKTKLVNEIENPKLEGEPVSQNEANADAPGRRRLTDSPVVNYKMSLDGMTATKGDAATLTNTQVQKRTKKDEKKFAASRKCCTFAIPKQRDNIPE